MKTETDSLKKSSDKIIETEQSARSSRAPDEENRTTRSFAEPERDRQRATVLRACVVQSHSETFTQDVTSNKGITSLENSATVRTA
jgi:hypothetical protein